MRILMIGAGGVGDAAARIAVERDFFELLVVADYDLARAEAHRRQRHRPADAGEERLVAAGRGRLRRRLPWRRWR